MLDLTVSSGPHGPGPQVALEDSYRRLCRIASTSRTAVESAMLTNMADPKKSSISKYELRSCLQRAQIGLSFDEIGQLMSYVTPQLDGSISIDAFWHMVDDHMHHEETVSDALKISMKHSPSPHKALHPKVEKEKLHTAPVDKFLRLVASANSEPRKTKADYAAELSALSFRPPSSEAASPAPASAFRQSPKPASTALRRARSPPKTSPRKGPAQMALLRAKAGVTDMGAASSPVAGSPLQRVAPAPAPPPAAPSPAPAPPPSALDNPLAAFEAPQSSLHDPAEVAALKAKVEQQGKQLAASQERLMEETTKRMAAEAASSQRAPPLPALPAAAAGAGGGSPGPAEKILAVQKQASDLQGRLAAAEAENKKLKGEGEARASSLASQVAQMHELLGKEKQRREAVELALAHERAAAAAEAQNEAEAAKSAAEADSRELLGLKEQLAGARAALQAEAQARKDAEDKLAAVMEAGAGDKAARGQLQAELAVLQAEVESARRVVGEAAEASHLREVVQMLEQAIKDEAAGKRAAEEEAAVLREALIEAKAEAVGAAEGEKARGEELMERERRLLQTLMKQLHSSQAEQFKLDDYCQEMDRVYNSLEKLYMSLKQEDSHALEPGVIDEVVSGSAAPPQEEPTPAPPTAPPASVDMLMASSASINGKDIVPSSVVRPSSVTPRGPPPPTPASTDTAHIMDDLNTLRAEMQVLLNS